MIERQTIHDFCQRVVEIFQPVKIILFGSYAYGKPSFDSDVDLLVILPFTGSSAQKSAEILNQIEPPFAIDLLVRTPEQIQERLELGDFFIQEITQKGEILYEATYARVG